MPGSPEPFHQQVGRKALPFYHLMKNTKEFEWTDEAQIAFANLKKVLSTPPIIAVPREKEPLFLYIIAKSNIVSTVLVVEREEEGKAHGVQRLIYYFSEVLSASK